MVIVVAIGRRRGRGPGWRPRLAPLRRRRRLLVAIFRKGCRRRRRRRRRPRRRRTPDGWETMFPTRSVGVAAGSDPLRRAPRNPVCPWAVRRRAVSAEVGIGNASHGSYPLWLCPGHPPLEVGIGNSRHGSYPLWRCSGHPPLEAGIGNACPGSYPLEQHPGLPLLLLNSGQCAGATPMPFGPFGVVDPTTHA
jgi:hypothetical protein